MKETKYHFIMIIGIIITIIGLITKKYLFLLLLFPFGFKYFQEEKKSD